MTNKIHNPFDPRMPATGENFIGRQEELKNLLEYEPHSVIFGYSRFGKTSFLWRLSNSLKDNSKRDIVYIGYVGSNLRHLKKSLESELEDSNCSTSAIVKNADDLQSALTTLDKSYHNQEKKLFLLLDETVYLFSDKDAVQRFRDYNQRFNNLVFVYAIFPNTFEIMQESCSRFQDTVRMIPLKPFEIEDTKNLIGICKKHFKIEENLPEKVLDITGGFPYLIQGLMEKVVDYSLRRTSDKTILTPEKVDAVYDEYVSLSYACGPQMAHLWKQLEGYKLSQLQRTIISLLIENDGITIKDLIERTEDIHNNDPSLFLGALNPIYEPGVGIVMKKGDGLSIRGKILKDSFKELINYYGV